jgi:signal transduction histidine kinase
MAVDLRQYPVLYVDDDVALHTAFRYEHADRFTVLTAGSGEEAFEILRGEPIAILLADQVMQGQEIQGVEICARARVMRPDIVTMVVTAYKDIVGAVDAVNRGRVRAYFPKPWTERLGEVLEATIVGLHEARLARGVGMDLLRSGIEHTKLTVLEQVAHDVLNPVQTVRTHHLMATRIIEGARAKLVARGEEEVAAALGAALDHQEGSLAAVRVVADVAARFRPRGAHRPAPSERCDVVEVVSAVVSFLRADVERVATLEWTPVGNPVVRIERVALARVLTNLLLNAAQAMAERPGGNVTVEVEAREDAAVVRVRDTGPGIPVSEHWRVFEPYYTTRKDGSGLGLSIVRDLVEQANGKVAVQSAPGDGATFEVTLPLASR